MDDKLDARLELRLKSSTLAILKEIHAKHKIPPQELLRGLAEEVVAYYQEQQEFSFPIEVIPKAKKYGQGRAERTAS